eukprot:6415823-Pyramimonas_sp.AAC.1
MQSLFVDAVQIARDPFQVNRDPFYGRPYSSTVLVTNVRGFALYDPTIPRQPGVCPGCADNVNMRSFSHDKNL